MKRLRRWISKKLDAAVELVFATMIAGTIAISTFLALMGSAQVWSQ